VIHSITGEILPETARQRNAFAAGNPAKVCRLAENKTAKGRTFGRGEGVVIYFLGLHFSHSAQVLPASAQHFMVHEGFLAQHLLQEAQPVKLAVTQMSAAQRTRSFTVFMMLSVSSPIFSRLTTVGVATVKD
jgi:hypothetical protein